MGRKPAPQPLTLSDPSRLGQDADQGHDPSTAGTASPVVSPVESRSPRSLRASPLTSRFHPKRSKQNIRAAGKPSQQHQDQPAPDDTALPYPSITSAFAQQQQPSGPPPAGAPTQHGRSEAKKSTKTGFFHFNKTSKASNLYKPQNHHHTGSRGQLRSRGSDETSTSKHGGTYLSNTFLT